MTLKQLEEKIPYMKSVVYAQNKAIIVYEDESCHHIIMPERVCNMLELKLLEDIKLRTKIRFNPEPKERKRPAKPPRISKPFDRGLVIEMYNNNREYREMSKATGLALGTISGVIREMIWNGEIKKRLKLQKFDQYILDNLETKTQVEIAQDLGLKVRYIYDRKVKLKKMGVLK